MPRPRQSVERFRVKYVVSPTGCWLWQGCTLRDGYGRFYFEGRSVLAHRWLYEYEVGAVPNGLALDHLCRVRHCVNPQHLEPITWGENTLRGNTIPAAHAAKTHCPSGHAYDAENTYIYAGRRYCRACRVDRKAIA